MSATWLSVSERRQAAVSPRERLLPGGTGAATVQPVNADRATAVSRGLRTMSS